MKDYFPTFSIVDLCQDTLNIKFSHINFTFLNAIRRIVKSEVPVLAINSIRFEEYSGYLEEETLAHRLSLIPIICRDIDKLSYQKECSCEIGCSFCNVTFTLQKNGTDQNVTNVYSSDLKLVDPSNQYQSEVLSFPKNYHGILICRLNKGERIKLECTAVKSNAMNHAKFSASTVCFYKKLDTDDDDSYLFTLETNGNHQAVDVLRKSLEIFIDHNLFLKKHINKYMRDDECNIKVPFQDTILNPLQAEILKTYEKEIDLFLYKKSHVLSEQKDSQLEVYYDDTLVGPLDVKNYIQTSINRLITFTEIILSNLNENYYHYKIPNIEIK